MSKWVSRKVAMHAAGSATAVAALVAIVGAGSKWW